MKHDKKKLWQSSLQRERRQRHDLASLEGRFVGTNPHAGPVRTGPGIGTGITVFELRRNHFVNQVRVRSTMPAPWMNDRWSAS